MTNLPPDHATFDAGPSAHNDARPRLTTDRDVDICVVGAGLAGLTVARELARKGATVAVLEGRRVGWNASGHHLGTVLPGFGVPMEQIVERVGLNDARELWRLSQAGVDYVRATAVQCAPQTSIVDGALEVSTTDAGDQLISRLQMMEDFGADVEGWQVEQVRDALQTKSYFHALHFPQAFQIDSGEYVRGLAGLAEAAGARIYEETAVVNIDPAGIRKRVITPSARLRASHVVLAGNLHIGAPAVRLAKTLLPVWRYAGLTEPLGAKLADAVRFAGSVMDSDGVDHFRIVQGDRLLWASPETTWASNPESYARVIRQRIKAIFPELAGIRIDHMFSGAFGQTIHGMPQIGELRPGFWLVSGFGRQGLNTTAMGAQLIAQGILAGDDRWKLFAPFELVWAGGGPGRAVYQAAFSLMRGRSAIAGTVARVRERARLREDKREQDRKARIAAAKSRSARAAGASQRPRNSDTL